MDDTGASASPTGLAGAEAPEPPSRLGPSDGIPSAVTISGELYSFLMGEGPLEGVWFGDLNEGFKGAFWWRGLLRCAAGWPEPAGETEASTHYPPRPLKLDEEMLAIHLWDYFGGRRPRDLQRIAQGVPKATDAERDCYRKCAARIAKALEDEAAWQRSSNA